MALRSSEELARGGFGEVYFAVNDAGKEVALKQIQRNLEVEVRGVRHCLNLKHPNLISLYDIKFDAHNQGWIVMEYVSGGSLRDAMEQHPHGLPGDELNRWFGQLAAGVAYLHDHGIVHRDLKPANIFEDEGIVKIGDYGLSKYISCSRRGGQTESVGTFHYMAPEIGKGEYGKEIDIYAMGVMLFELATGTGPFDGESTQEIIMKHLTADPDLSRVSEPIRSVVARALQKTQPLDSAMCARWCDPWEWKLTIAICWFVPKWKSIPPVVNANWNPPPQPAHPPRFAAAARPAPAYAQPQLQPAGNYPPPRPVQLASYEEPIARSLKQGWSGINRWWYELNLTPLIRFVLSRIYDHGLRVERRLAAKFVDYGFDFLWFPTMRFGGCSKVRLLLYLYRQYNAVLGNVALKLLPGTAAFAPASSTDCRTSHPTTGCRESSLEHQAMACRQATSIGSSEKKRCVE